MEEGPCAPAAAEGVGVNMVPVVLYIVVGILMWVGATLISRHLAAPTPSPGPSRATPALSSAHVG
jgi:ABC-type xylose transport system permease subunit